MQDYVLWIELELREISTGVSYCWVGEEASCALTQADSRVCAEMEGEQSLTSRGINLSN